MKRSAYIFLGFLLLQSLCFGQAKITIKIDTEKSYDSLKIQAYDTEQEFSPILEQKFSNTAVLSTKKSLHPGIYWILFDKTLGGAFLISPNSKQDFSIQITDSDVIFSETPENEHYKDYLNHVQTFDAQMQGLNQEFQDAKSRLPQYMLGPIVDTLNAKATRIAAEKERYQRQVIAENPHTTLAGIVQCGIEIPQPTKEIASDRMKMQEYYVSHYFDNFPWDYPYIFNTPIAKDKVKEFCSIISQLQRPEFDQYVMHALQSAKIDTATYFAFFDEVEKILGDHGSPLKIERLYIKMLKDMLTISKLPGNRQRHCTYELGVIDKNHVGDIAPNFKIVTHTGDTTTLHDIQAEYLLLYLQHPTCPTCQKVRGMMANFPFLNKAIASGRLKVLTVYFEDDAEIWKNYIHSNEANPSYMHGWNFDQSIEQNALYDTRAIPYMFILDKDKRILKKNVMETVLEDEIKMLNILN
ncbi:MAG: DUF5106 domain-containing protein [Bacteroidales bacterium]|nr:DUF5106 domain-containing protein [Bacteroidales bacterium]